MIYRVYTFGLAILLLLAARRANADSVSFDEAIFASARVPRVVASQAELKARTQGDRSIPSNRGPLTLSISPGHRLSPASESGVEIGVAVDQSWNLSDLHKQSKRAASAEREVIHARLRAASLASRVEVAKRWFALRRAETLYHLVQDELRSAKAFSARQSKARVAGIATAVEEASAIAAVAQTKGLVLALEGQRVEAALALCLSMGRLPDESLATKAPLPAPTLPSQVEIKLLTSRIPQMPQIALRRLQGIAAKARASELLSTKGRTLSLGLAMQRESTGSTLLVGSVAMTFAGANRGQRERSILQAQSLRSREEEKDLVNRVRVELKDATHEVEHTYEEYQLITTELLPAFERLLKLRQKELSNGEGTFIEVLRSQTEFYRGQRMAKASEIDHRWAQVHLWLLLAELKQSFSQGNQR